MKSKIVCVFSFLATTDLIITTEKKTLNGDEINDNPWSWEGFHL